MIIKHKFFSKLILLKKKQQQQQQKTIKKGHFQFFNERHRLTTLNNPVLRLHEIIIFIV